MDGVFNLSWLQVVLVAAGLTHFTIIAVTLYLHRSMSHRSLDLSPVLTHVFRLWLWLTTGMKTKEWVAVHRKHHADVDTEGDPHSPVIYGVWKVLFLGVWLYRKSAKNQDVLEKYGHDCPNDWVERHIYRHWNIGVLLMLAIDIFMWGNKGIAIWIVQMVWIPFTAAGVINGIGHAFGYRNFEPGDASKNILPWGILIGGEELHNNHHAYPRSARLSARPFEFDLGYVYIRLLSYVGLAKVRYVMPYEIESGGMKALLNARMHVFRMFSHEVMKKMIQNSMLSHDLSSILNIKKLKYLMLTNPKLLKETDRLVLRKTLILDDRLKRLYQLKEQLYDIFYSNQYKNRFEALRQWCNTAKSFDESVLSHFVGMIEQRYLEVSASV
jgi:stearoyl-CoA desaturase (delta-9 desaturase)